MKKSVWIAIISVLLVSLISFAVFALEETEPNENLATATEIPFNTAVEGNLSSSTDKDWYKFSLAEDGIVSISFTHEKIDNSVTYWYIAVYKADGSTYYNNVETYHPVYGNADVTLPDMGLPAGDYYILVFPYSYSNLKYAITVNFTPSASCETEDNNTFTTADNISVNQEYTGALSASLDIDWYKFTLDSDGYVSIVFNHAKIDDSDDYWRISVFKGDGVNYYNNIENYYPVAGNADRTLPDIGLAAGEYYVRVIKGDGDNSLYNYSLTVNFTATEKYETEENNSFNTADEISVNQEYNGVIGTYNDVDWYKVSIPEDGYVSIAFNHAKIDDADDYWRVVVYQGDGVTYFNGVESIYAVAGNADSILPNMGFDKGEYYIKVMQGDGDQSLITYSFTVNFTATDNYEKELNNTFNDANTISVNKAYSGTISAWNDIDWFKFSLNTTGYISISISHDKFSDEDDYWRVSLYQGDGVTYIEKGDGIYYVNGNADLVLPDIGLGSGDYLIKVIPGDGDYTFRDYNIMVNFYQSDEWESELNNSKEEASVISLNSTVNGSLSAYNDVDWYKFSLKSPTSLNIKFNHELLQYSDPYWRIHIYKSDGVSTAGEFEYWDVSLNSMREISDLNLSEGTYYIYITRHGGNWIDDTYQMTVSQTHECTAGAWAVTKEANCLTEGIRSKCCNICSAPMETEIIPASGHASDNWQIDAEPTCISLGSRQGLCSICGEYVEEQIEMLPHDFSEWEVTVEATCSSQGARTHTCTVCNETETEVVEALSHTFGEWTHKSGNKVIPPIVHERVCSLCGTTETQNDWSYVWVTIIVGIVGVGVLIGVINYVKSFLKTK